MNTMMNSEVNSNKKPTGSETTGSETYELVLLFETCFDLISNKLFAGFNTDIENRPS